MWALGDHTSELPASIIASRPPTSLVKVDVTVVAKGYRASKLIGSSVTNDKNENVGKIDDISKIFWETKQA